MNYLWEVMLQIQGLPEPNIHFQMAKRYSPYMEVSNTYLNQKEIGKPGRIEIEVNPYYRFYKIFKDMFHPETKEFPMLRDSLTNLIFHQLAQNDVMSGMTREEYYKKLLYQDILANRFGRDANNAMGLFLIEEKKIILSGMLRQYETGSSVDIFKDMIVELIPNNIIYRNNENYHEILIYIGQKREERIESKMNFLIKMFLEIPYYVNIYYHYHFGILGINETMMIDEIALC